MKECLFGLFSKFGEVLAVSAKRNVVMRGQAFVVFKSKGDAGSALRGLNGNQFFGKNMEIQWAKRDSDFLLKEKNRSNKLGRSRLITKSYFNSHKFKDRMARKMNQRSKEIQALKVHGMSYLDHMLDPKRSTQPNGSAQHPLNNIQNLSGNLPSNPVPGTVNGELIPKTSKKPMNEPNNILLLEKLPDIETDELIKLFQQYEGFKEVRHIRPRRVAFIDFSTSILAANALTGAMTQEVGENEKLNINFAKK